MSTLAPVEQDLSQVTFHWHYTGAAHGHQARQRSSNMSGVQTIFWESDSRNVQETCGCFCASIWLLVLASGPSARPLSRLIYCTPSGDFVIHWSVVLDQLGQHVRLAVRPARKTRCTTSRHASPLHGMCLFKQETKQFCAYDNYLVPA